MTWGFEITVPVRDARRRNIGLRIYGILALLMGSAHLAAGVATVIAVPEPGQSRWFGLIFVGSGSLALTFGWWLCRRRPYRPDLGDVHPFLRKSAGYSDGYDGPTGPRTWWTGDPVPPASIQGARAPTPNEELKPPASPSTLVE